MSNNKESIGYVAKVAFILCVVCSIIISTAAVMLKPAQQENKARDFKRNILLAAGMLEEGVSIEEAFKSVETRIVDLTTGEITDEVNPDEYDQRRAASDTALSVQLEPDQDLAKIGRQEKYAEVYFATDAEGQDVLILPVRGYGLWGTLYGFVAVGPDFNTVVGMGFYEHKETPGLGGEVDNPNWKGLWKGKKLYDDEGNVALEVIKGSADRNDRNYQYKIDGLSGATLTSRGVHNLVQFWFGENGYKSFLANLKRGDA